MKNSFMLYCDQYEPIRSLTFEQKGMLFDAIFKFQCGENLSFDDAMVEMAFSFFKQTFVRDNDKYVKKCEKNKANITKRWNKKDTTVYDRIPSDTNHTDSGSDSHSDIYSDELKTFVSKYQNYIFEKFGMPKVNNTLLKNCCSTLDKLTRIDGHEFGLIISALKWSYMDDFWHVQIKSLAGLRKTQKNGMKKFENLLTAYQKTDPKPKTKKVYTGL